MLLEPPPLPRVKLTSVSPSAFAPVGLPTMPSALAATAGGRSRSARSAQQASKKKPIVALPLTERELDVAHRVARGEANKIIARELGISPYTVRDYVSRLLQKFDVNSRTRLASALAQKLSVKYG